MFVGSARIELRVRGASSLKEKRSVIRSLKDRIRQRALAAVAEVDHQDLWQRAALGVAVVAADHGQAAQLLQTIRSLVESAPGAELLDWQEQIE